MCTCNNCFRRRWVYASNFKKIEKIKDYVGEDKFNIGKFEKAIQLFDEFVLAKDFQEFLTLEAYKYI